MGLVGQLRTPIQVVNCRIVTRFFAHRALHNSEAIVPCLENEQCHGKMMSTPSSSHRGRDCHSVPEGRSFISDSIFIGTYVNLGDERKRMARQVTGHPWRRVLMGEVLWGGDVNERAEAVRGEELIALCGRGVEDIHLSLEERHLDGITHGDAGDAAGGDGSADHCCR